MNQSQAARILETLARTEPDYDALSEEYGAVLSEDWRERVSEDFPEQALNLLRTDPDTAGQIDLYDSLFSISSSPHTGSTDSFGVEDILTPELIVAVMVLLSVHFHIKREKNGKWTFEAGFQPLNAQALKPVLSVVAAVIGEFGEGLVELSEKLGGQADAG